MQMILTSSPPSVRLALFQCPNTDRSSIVPALRGLPRFPCVRNHPPTCCSRQRLQTMKPYTESLWAAGQCLMKDSGTAERITNARLLDTIRFTHTHKYLQIYVASKHTHIDIHMHTHSRNTNTLSCKGLSQPQGSRAGVSSSGGGWWDRWMDGGRLDGWGDLKNCASQSSEPTSVSAQSWFGQRPGPVCWHR